MGNKKLADIEAAINSAMQNIVSLTQVIEADNLGDSETESMISLIHELIAEKEDLEGQKQQLMAKRRQKAEKKKEQAKKTSVAKRRAWLKKLSTSQLEAQASVIRAIPERMRSRAMSDRLESINTELNLRKKKNRSYVQICQGGAPGMGRKS